MRVPFPAGHLGYEQGDRDDELGKVALAGRTRSHMEGEGGACHLR